LAESFVWIPISMGMTGLGHVQQAAVRYKPTAALTNLHRTFNTCPAIALSLPKGDGGSKIEGRPEISGW